MGFIVAWIKNQKKIVYKKKTISNTDLYNVLRFYGVKCPIYLADNSYEIIDFNELVKLVRSIDTFKLKYKKEVFDCDDYSVLFYVRAKVGTKRAIGIAWSKTHAFNIAICHYKDYVELFVIEPQLGDVYTYDSIKDNKMYRIDRFVLM